METEDVVKKKYRLSLLYLLKDLLIEMNNQVYSLNI